MLIVRKGPTSHLPLHYDDDDNDTIEIPPTEILDRIFIRSPRFNFEKSQGGLLKLRTESHIVLIQYGNPRCNLESDGRFYFFAPPLRGNLAK